MLHYCTMYPQAASIVAGDFNHSNLKAVLPKYYQHVSCPTRGERTSDHCYSIIKGAYKSVSRPHFAKSDHSSVLMLRVYKQEIKRAKPIVGQFSADRRITRRDCRTALNQLPGPFSETPWTWTTMLMLVPAMWILRGHLYSAVFDAGEGQCYKETRYALRSTIKAAKDLHRNKLEQHYSNGDARHMWWGLQDFTGYKSKPSGLSSTTDSFLEELSGF